MNSQKISSFPNTFRPHHNYMINQTFKESPKIKVIFGLPMRHGACTTQSIGTIPPTDSRRIDALRNT